MELRVRNKVFIQYDTAEDRVQFCIIFVAYREWINLVIVSARHSDILLFLFLLINVLIVSHFRPGVTNLFEPESYFMDTESYEGHPFSSEITNLLSLPLVIY